MKCIRTFFSKYLFVGIIFCSTILCLPSIVEASSSDGSKLPLGDGKVSTTPKVGYLYSCQTIFNGKGAQTDGTWLHGTTWNEAEKVHVQGAVTWPGAHFSIEDNDYGGRVITGNGLPSGVITGVFPISQTDPAYAFDHNPNSITTQSFSYTLLTHPSMADSPSCVPMGIIGVTLNGVAIYSAVDGVGRDAVAHEVQDTCGGHPEMKGVYHFHSGSSCLPEQSENNTLVGYALDGFGIYSNRDDTGNEISTKDLDECHGSTSEIMWDGKKVAMYHYVITKDYPYTVGCFKGTPVTLSTISASIKQNSTSTIVPVRIQNNLSVGTVGNDVVLLQNALEQARYLVMPEGVQKGKFGGATRDALKEFQRVNGISPTGMFGPKTRELFATQREKINIISPQPQPQPKPQTNDAPRMVTMPPKAISTSKDKPVPGTVSSSMPLPPKATSTNKNKQETNNDLKIIKGGSAIDVSKQNGYVQIRSSTSSSTVGGSQDKKPQAAVSGNEQTCKSKQTGSPCSYTLSNGRSFSGTCNEALGGLSCN